MARGIAPGLVARGPAAVLAAAFVLVLLAGCPAPAGSPRGGDAAPGEGAVQSDAAALGLGSFRLAGARAVVDGDTLRVEGLEKSLRLVALDAEEVFHDPRERELAERDFDAYVRDRSAGSARPAKYPTPFGERAREWAKRALAGADSVTLELDDPRVSRGYYERPLVHVFVERDGEPWHYNLEAVRAGMSPYFVKYGRSRRFDAAFRAAADEARAAGRGIWSADERHYPDYDERLAWWRRRAEAIERFERARAAHPDWVRLGEDGATERLLALEGRVVTIFAEAGAPKLERRPYLLPLRHRAKDDVNIVAFRGGGFRRFAEAARSSDHVLVRGRVSVHRGRPQILLDDVERVEGG